MAQPARTLSPLHMEDLEPHRFEDLVRQLLYDFRPWRRLEATGRSGGDDGFDARGWEIVATEVDLDTSDDADGEMEEAPADRDSAGDRQWLIQCKREKRIGPSQIEKYVLYIAEKEISAVHGIVFAAACDFSKKARDAFRAACASRGISEWHLWGKAEIEDRLYQPANDHLLFAYFGFSLRIRKRSLKTAIRTRLATKRSAARILAKAYGPVLIRDASDDRYPYLDEGAVDDRVVRGRWIVRTIDGLDPDALRVLVSTHFAVLEIDGSWDYAELMDDAKFGPYDDPWCDSSADEARSQGRSEASDIWLALPVHKRAWYETIHRIPFDDILAIDQDGDEWFRHPQIYTAEWDRQDGPFKGEYGRVQTIDSAPRTEYVKSRGEGRIQVFERARSK